MTITKEITTQQSNEFKHYHGRALNKQVWINWKPKNKSENVMKIQLQETLKWIKTLEPINQWNEISDWE